MKKSLFETVCMGDLNLKNRIAMAPMTLAEFRAHYDGIIIGNCGYIKEDAEQRLAEGVMDIAAFGRPFITNRDLVARLPNNHPLTPFEDMSKWYTSGPEGYIDNQPYGQ